MNQKWSLIEVYLTSEFVFIMSCLNSDCLCIKSSTLNTESRQEKLQTLEGKVRWKQQFI